MMENQRNSKEDLFWCHIFCNESHKMKSGLKPRFEGEPVSERLSYCSNYTQSAMNNVCIQ